MTKQAKRRGTDPEHDNPLDMAVSARDRSTLRMVTEAVEHQQVMLAYQPIVQARAPFGVAFYEALVRVLDPTGRVIPARDFMPQIEDEELGRDLDCAALKQGLRVLTKNPNLRLSVNVSARSIGYRRWLNVLDRAHSRNPSLCERLILEFSEASVMAVPELVSDFMLRMQPRGISFAMDEFGAAATSLRHLRNLYFDLVKIDGQFVRGIQENPDNQVLCTALVGLAQQFDMFTVAVSVENREDAQFLIQQGVDCLQGYLFGAPTVRPPWLPKQKHRASA